MQHFETVTANLDSPGGDVLAAIEIGDIVRGNWIWTIVDNNTQCSSACVFILAAGAERCAGESSVRIHRPHFDAKLFGQLGQSQAKAKYDGLIDGVRQYLSRMGMSEQLFQAMMAVRSDDARTLTIAEMKAMNLVGEDPGYVEWMRALVLPIADDAFLPVVVSLQAKPPCDLAGDCDSRGRTLGPRRLPVRVSRLS